MNNYRKNAGYDDISVIEVRNKSSTKSQNTNNVLKVQKDDHIFKYTDSDLEYQKKSESLSNTPHQSQKQYQSRKYGQIHSRQNDKMTLNEAKTPQFVRKSKASKPQHINQKMMSINLTNSIPMTLTFQKNKAKIQNVQQRKFRIFPQAQTIKFTLPTLDEYYSKPLTIIKKQKQKQNQPNLTIQESSEISINKKMNISASTFFGFGHNNDHKLKKPSNDKNRSFNKNKQIDSRIAFKKSQDEIKQQEQDQSVEQDSKDKLISPNFVDYKSKGVYLLLGFLLSIIVMILIKKII